jgi:hypothetical protein
VISPVLPLTEEHDRNFESDNETCVGCILTLLSDQLYDIHIHHEVARDLWETLDQMYTESDAGRELSGTIIRGTLKTPNSQLVTLISIKLQRPDGYD